MKPVILVTRKLPDAVEDRLRRDYDARLNPEDVLYSRDELIERARDVDAILPCHTEKFTAEGLARLPGRVRAIADFPPEKITKVQDLLYFFKIAIKREKEVIGSIRWNKRREQALHCFWLLA